MSQEQFIRNQLRTQPICSVENKHLKELQRNSTIAVDRIRAILSDSFMHAPDMKALVCFFETLFLEHHEYGPNVEQGIYALRKTINSHVYKATKLGVRSIEGFVYNTVFIDKGIETIIKVPQGQENVDTLLKEYYIGIYAINNLRYKTPIFMFTLSGFMCSTPEKKRGKASVEFCPKSSVSERIPHILFEKIHGPSMENWVSDNTHTFNDWLEIFMQMLLGLEVALRDYGFTHYDLHTGNVMLRQSSSQEPYTYSVLLGTQTYTVTTQMIPTIIDFGMSAMQVHGRRIHTSGLEHVGITSAIRPGIDMYKFMVFSAYYAHETLRQKIMDLFKLFPGRIGTKITTRREFGLEFAVMKYGLDALDYDEINTITPLMMYDKIATLFPTIVQRFIKSSNRMTAYPIQLPTTLYTYNALFGKEREGAMKSSTVAVSCIERSSSYILSSYNLMLLTVLEKALKYDSRALNTLKNRFDEYMVSNQDTLIYRDVAMLMSTALPPLPSTEVEYTQYNNGFAQQNVSARDFLEKMLPMLMLYYTILEVNLDMLFPEWIETFESSPAFNYYSSYASQIHLEAATRSGYTVYGDSL